MTRRSRAVVSAPAKINLFLHVGNRRADGYHDLESLVAFAEMGDEIELVRDDGFSLSIGGPFAQGLAAGEENLALRAARLLASRADVTSGVRIRLTKNIPVAAGLGGGSADAAAVLRGLVPLWNPDLARQTLREVAAALGSDVPVCLTSAPSWMEGAGERITPLPSLPAMPLLLVNPGVPVPTAAVFAGLRGRRGLGLPCPTARFADGSALLRFLRNTTNDLEDPARAIAPAIGDVLEELISLPGLSLARMSGSGATCYAVFESESALGAAGTLLMQRNPDWWVVATRLAPADAANRIVVQ